MINLIDMANAIGAKIINQKDEMSSGISIDSRTIKKGETFFALKGENTDGRLFIKDAVGKGASSIVISKPAPNISGVTVLEVEDSEIALRKAGLWARNLFPNPVIAIVGSCGKTSVKDFTARLLSEKYRVYKSLGNLNNLIGLPISLLNGDKNADLWVTELGISHPLEMESLAPIASPDTIIWTNVNVVHTEFFESLQDILNEKAKALLYIKGNQVIICGDDPLLKDLSVKFPILSFTSFGMDPSNDVVLNLLEDKAEEGLLIRIVYGEQEITEQVKIPGSLNIYNIGAAVTACLIYGMSLIEIQPAFKKLETSNHRGRIHNLKGDVCLWDDSYNSNPASMKGVIGSAGLSSRRCVAIFGDMLELGEKSGEYHREIGAWAADRGIETLIGVGRESHEMVKSFLECGGRSGLHVTNREEAKKILYQIIRDGDLIIIKGSRMISLDILCDDIIKERGNI